MEKSIMDEVFDVISGDNERFARIQDQGRRGRAPMEKSDLPSHAPIADTRHEQDKKDSKMSLCA